MIEGDEDCVFEGDPFLIRHAVLNLIQNAIDFSPAGGKVTAKSMKKGDYITLNVLNEGSGIPEYAAGRIFERFYSLKRPDTGKKSSGLGLCLVKEVAVLHRGTIELVNSPEGGVIATLTLPIKPA
jgi:two-component system sensor histidine kinase CreC